MIHHKMIHHRTSRRLRVIVQDADSNSTTVGHLYAGDHFGEGALLSGQGHRATVQAVEDGDVLQVPKDEFCKKIKKAKGVTLWAPAMSPKAKVRIN